MLKLIELETRTIKPTHRFFSYDSPRWIRVVEYFIRVRVFGQPSYLIDRWTIVEDTISEGMIGLDEIDLEFDRRLDEYKQAQSDALWSRFDYDDPKEWIKVVEKAMLSARLWEFGYYSPTYYDNTSLLADDKFVDKLKRNRRQVWRWAKESEAKSRDNKR